MPKSVLITGAARRIGAACAQLMHQRGWNVLLHYRESFYEAHALCEELNQLRSGSATLFKADLSNSVQLNALAEYATNSWEGVDALINNASTFFPSAFAETSEQDWQSLLDANVKAPFFLTQALLPILRKRRGCVVNMVDIHAETGLPGYAAYSLSKAALVNMTHCLAKELAPDIRVNAVAPGAILWTEHQDTDYQQQILQKIPLQRCGDVKDIAQAVCFLIEDAIYITGQVLTVDGGRTLSR